jgi:hypothetical protein
MRFKRPIIIAAVVAATLAVANFTPATITQSEVSENYPPVVLSLIHI